MSNLIPFEQTGVPAARVSRFAVTTDLLSNPGGGFPRVSIKGKVFHIHRGDEAELLTKPGSPDEPAASIEAVILGVFPGAGKTAKVFYESAFSEGSDAKPTCYSNDGVAPATDAESPQCQTCAACPHNQWGSKITENNTKGKACQDSKRLAIASLDALNDPMLLRVPAASLKPLGEFNKLIASRGYAFQEIVTKIGFDYSVAHPALTFKPVAVLDDATIDQVVEATQLDVTQSILGCDVLTTAPAVQAPPPSKPALAASAGGAVDADVVVEKAPAKAAPPKKTPAKAPAPAKAAAAAATTTPAQVQTVDAEDGLASSLNDLDFDD